MKLNKQTLKRIIKEELDAAMNEIRVKPDLPGIPNDYIEKINSLIDSGEVEQASSLIDGLGLDPGYVDKYIEYQQVGDIEKLGNKQRDLYASHGGSDSWEYLDHPFHDEVDAIQGQIDDLATKKAYDHLGEIIPGNQKSFDDIYRAIHMHKNRRGSLKVGPKK
tara:strand:+ start:75 stop:563 length:489 start_codon:yes stop_codon:yes gene_type:complete